MKRLKYIIEVRENACCEDGEGLFSHVDMLVTAFL
jgi:hypothetical protein